MKIQASSWHRVKNCPGSLFLTPPEGEEYRPFGDQAYLGSLIHEAAEMTLRSRVMTKTRVSVELRVLGMKKDNPDFERALHTGWYYVSWIKTRMRGGELLIEEKRRQDVGGHDCVAKFDAAIVKGKDVEVVDLKTGNFDYSASAPDQIELTALMFPGMNVTGTIVQPWYWEEAYRVVSGIEVPRARVAAVMGEIATIEARRDMVVAGPWCNFCPSLQICPSARLDVAVVEKLTEITPLDRLSSEDLGKLWRGKRRLLNYLDSLDDVIKTRLARGEVVPGVVMERANGRRAWRDEDEVKKALDYLGPELYDVKLKTPAQVEKLAGKKNIEGLVVKPTIERLAGKKEIDWGTV